MGKHLTLALLLSVHLVAPAALAQNLVPSAPADQPAPPADQPAAPVEAPAVDAATAPPPPTPPVAGPAQQESDMAAKIASLETKIAALEEASKGNQDAIASASKLKFSGYVQGRYEWHDGSTNGAAFDPKTGSATATNNNRFLVRHAYLTTQYLGSHAEYLMQIDANNRDGLAFKDVFASFIDTWTPLNLKLSVGQFKYPFGYELLQSDADREMPERAAIEKFFFDGDRDRGLRLQGKYAFFNFAVALVNGTVSDGTNNLAASKDPAPFGSKDPNEFKDWVGRLGLDFGSIVGGLSGYFGKGLYIMPPVVVPWDTTQNKTPVYDSRYKYRLGADIQGYLDVPGLGGLALKGEVMVGWDTARQYHGIPADPCKSSATWGFILTAVQNLPANLGVVARVDLKDTLAGSISDNGTCAQQKTAAQTDRVVTAGGGLLYYATPNLKATVTYEHPTEQAGAKKDNDFAMAQLQARF